MVLDETDDKKLIHLLWRTMAYMHEVRDELEVLKDFVSKGDQHPLPHSVCTSYLREECGLEKVWDHAKKNFLIKSSLDPGKAKDLDSH